MEETNKGDTMTSYSIKKKIKMKIKKKFGSWINEPEEVTKDMVGFFPIKGFEGLYETNGKGEIYSKERIVWNGKANHILRRRKLKSALAACGYPKITLRKNKKSYQRYVHRLVLETFKPFSLGLECNHVDGNKLNNNIENLEWVTKKQNITHSYKNNLHPSGENHYNAKIKNDTVKEIRKYFKKGVKQVELAKMYNIGFRTINQIVRNKIYRWI